MLSFESLGLNAPLLEAVRDLGYENPTPIQAEVIPMLLESETDLVALAQTGTGKTAAFGLPLLQKTEVDQRKTPANHCRHAWSDQGYDWPGYDQPFEHRVLHSR